MIAKYSQSEKFKIFIKKLFDLILSPLTLLSVLWLRQIRKWGIIFMSCSNSIFERNACYPVTDHYYDPLFLPKDVHYPLISDRLLPGIDMRVEEQLIHLKKFNCEKELINIPWNQEHPLRFHYNNIFFKPGDAEYLYQMVRTVKPGRIIEVGCGYSTLMINEALSRNKAEDSEYTCDHICIEPYESPWLEKLGVKVVRQKVEDLGGEFFSKLDKNNFLFIDSSHIVKTQGDVVFQYLQVIPALNSGVFIHIHDIFTPKDYPEEWLFKYKFFWNEQYLVEALLTHNNSLKVVGALNYLYNHYFKELKEKCPMLNKVPAHNQPASLWLQKS